MLDENLFCRIFICQCRLNRLLPLFIVRGKLCSSFWSIYRHGDGSPEGNERVPRQPVRITYTSQKHGSCFLAAFKHQSVLEVELLGFSHLLDLSSWKFQCVWGIIGGDAIFPVHILNALMFPLGEPHLSFALEMSLLPSSDFVSSLLIKLDDTNMKFYWKRFLLSTLLHSDVWGLLAYKAHSPFHVGSLPVQVLHCRLIYDTNPFRT